jgi:hypothetical protein
VFRSLASSADRILVAAQLKPELRGTGKGAFPTHAPHIYTFIRLLVDEMEQLDLASLSISEYPRCEVCCDLNVYHLTILAGSLSRSAEQGCESCSLLKQGIDHFIKSYESIHILVDCSLSVTVVDENKSPLGIVEFYTHKGKSRISLKLRTNFQYDIQHKFQVSTNKLR